ncbi:MAG: type III-B CRISPR-associated protein Cas10/Cmr2 [Infirmifilum sp.]
MEELFRLKIAALLHDPPNKPWLLLEGRNHEEEALRYLKPLDIDSIPREVKAADALASSVDRQILSMFFRDKYQSGVFPCREAVLRNTINPLHEVTLPPIRDEKVAEYREKLLKILEGVRDVKLRYLLLYSLYEALWIDMGLPVGPADTRTPTHTVFDHNYATATALNWVYLSGGSGSEAGVEGTIVGLDAAGVQEFVASSRKLRDAWASSYLVSALLWYTLIPLVDAFGPDVVITPSLRLNPFFVDWVSSKLKGLGEEVQKALERLLDVTYLYHEQLREMRDELGVPPYAVFPERATLILPPADVVRKVLGKDIKEFLEERFRKGWSELFELAKASSGRPSGLVGEFLTRVFEYYDRYFNGSGFEENPPLLLRVEVVEVKHDASLSRHELYDHYYTELSKKLSMRKWKKIDPEFRLDLQGLTERAFVTPLGAPKQSERGFDYCTVCGKLPALVVLPSESDGGVVDEYAFYVYGFLVKKWDPQKISEELEKIRAGTASAPEEYLKWREEKSAELESLKVVFTPGERLCPWCFVKRILSINPQLFKLLVTGASPTGALPLSRSSFSFPSVSDIASLRLKEKVVRKVLAGEEGLLDDLKSLVRGLLESKEALNQVRTAQRPWWAERELVKEIQGKLREGRGGHEEGEAGLVLEIVLKGNPESMWLGEGVAQRGWLATLAKYKLSGYLWRYYGLILADGDSMGDLLEGNLEALNRMKGECGKDEKLPSVVKSIISSWGSCELERLLNGLVAEENREKIKEMWSQKLAGELCATPEECMELLNSIEEKLSKIVQGEPPKREPGKIPLTISYHTAISSALMRAALIDVILVSKHGGFVLYAGGDDLMALLPVDSIPELVYESRAAFAGAPLEISEDKSVRCEDGFLKVKEASLPLLPGVGRSYYAGVVHYLYPLNLVMHRARSMLKLAKNEMETQVYYSSGAVERLAKDMLLVDYLPRRTGSFTGLQLSFYRVSHISAFDRRRGTKAYLGGVGYSAKLLKNLLDRVSGFSGNALYSTSLLYDVDGANDMLVEATRQYPELVHSLVDRILERNMATGKKSVGSGWDLLESGALDIKEDAASKNKDLSERTLASVVKVERGEENRDEVELHFFTSLAQATRFLLGGMG